VTSPLLVRAAAVSQVFVDDLAVPELSADDEKHLAKVLRVRAGEVVIAADGRGAWRTCQWTAQSSLDPTGDVCIEDAPTPSITIAFALLKGDRNEWVVQKLTELGVDKIAPFVSERTIVHWDEAKAARNVERFNRVAREAAMQSRRIFLPSIADVATFEAVQSGGAAVAQAGGDALSLSHTTVAIGPEGGWSSDELRVHNASVALGETILRAETASIAAATLLTALRANTVSEKNPLHRA